MVWANHLITYYRWMILLVKVLLFKKQTSYWVVQFAGGVTIDIICDSVSALHTTITGKTSI